MNQRVIPVEILAVVITIVGGALGWLIARLWKKVDESIKNLQIGMEQIYKFMTDSHDYGAKIEDHEDRIEKIEDWTRVLTLKHNGNHPDQPLKLLLSHKDTK